MSILKRLTGAVCAVALCLNATSAVFAAQMGAHTQSGVAVVSLDVDDKYLEGVDINDDPSYIKFVKNQQTVGVTDFSSLVTHQERFNAFNKVYGIDVSVYNGDIDFEKVKSEGYQFVIVRAGARGYGKAGNMIEDTRFEEHVDNAHKAGLKVGVYYYTQAVNKAEVKQEAEVTLKKINGRKLEMPVYFDIEPAYDWDGQPGRLVAANLSKAQKAELCQYFCDLINDAGYESGVTSCKSWFEWEIDMSKLENKYDIWLAHYTTSTNYASDYNMWQFNSTRKVNGVYSNCTDQDVRYVNDMKPSGNHDLKFSVTASSVVLRWNATVNTQGYLIYKKDASGNAVQVGKTKELTYTLPRQEDNCEYYIRSYNCVDNEYYYSSPSATVSVTGVKANGLAATGVTQSSITLKWNAIHAASGYCVYADDKYQGYCNSTSFTISGLAAGTQHKIKVAAFFNKDASKEYTTASVMGVYSDALYVTTEKATQTPTPTPTPPATGTGDVKTTALAGSNRYSTAVLISQQTFPSGANTVVLASGDSYADALVSAPLANAYNAPVLLTSKDIITGTTLAEIQRLKATSVYIVGGEGVVSKTVEDTLKAKGLNVFRIHSSSVPNRYGTSVYVSANMDIKRGKGPSDIFICYSMNYADTLSAGSVAAIKDAPILYMDTPGYLDGATKYYLDSVKSSIKNIYIIGGTGVIGSQAEKTLAEYGTVKRLAGANRYETCLEVNKYFAGVLTGKSVCVTTGQNFPDALAGGVLAAKNKAPVVIADGVLTASQKSYLAGRAPSQLYTFGGAGISASSIQSAIKS